MPDEQTTSRSTNRDMLRHLPAAILAVIIVAFAVDNRQQVRVGFVFTDEKVPLVLVLLATAVIGALIGALLSRRHR